MPRPHESATAFDDYAVEDDRAYCALDRRFKFIQEGNSRARFPSVHILDVASLPDAQRSALGITTDSGPCLLVGAGLTQMWSTAWTAPTEFDERSRELMPFIRSAVRRGLDAGLAVVAPSVGARDLGIFADVPEADVEVSPGEPHYVLDLGGAHDPDGFLKGLGRKHRQTWTADLKEEAGTGLKVSLSSLTAETATEISTAVAATSSRNGAVEHPLLAEWRIAGYLRRPGNHTVARIARGESAVGFAVWAEWRHSVIAHTFAIEDHIDDRTDVYHRAYAACLRDALSRQVKEIRFGPRHAQPKRSRGCASISRWTITYRPR